jgi:hypothetical protein
MTDDVIVLDANRQNKNADRYLNIDCELLDLARLTDLAVETHYREAIEEHAVSEFGPTTDFVLRELQSRIHEIVRRLWDRQYGADPAA